MHHFAPALKKLYCMAFGIGSKRGLFRLSAASELAAEDVLPASAEAPLRAIGQVVCTAGHEALAVIPLDAGDGPFFVAGARCERRPLLDGLAR